MKQLHFNTPQFFRAFIFINIIVERLSSITKLAKHFMENPILPFDKSRSVAHLTDSFHLIFRTSLSVLLLLLLFSIYLFIYLFGFKSYISNLKKPSCFASHWLEKKKKKAQTQSMVFITEPDREVESWKLGTGMKTSFLSLKNQIFC